MYRFCPTQKSGWKSDVQRQRNSWHWLKLPSAATDGVELCQIHKTAPGTIASMVLRLTDWKISLLPQAHLLMMMCEQNVVIFSLFSVLSLWTLYRFIHTLDKERNEKRRKKTAVKRQSGGWRVKYNRMTVQVHYSMYTMLWPCGWAECLGSVVVCCAWWGSLT